MFDLRRFRKDFGLNQDDIGELVGVSQAFISKIERGIEIFPPSYLIRLREKYESCIDDYIINEDHVYIEDSPAKVGVPYYENIDISAGIKEMFNDSKESPTFYINYQHFNDATAYLPVVGDSMYPKYASGEIIAVKKINNIGLILWGEAYLVVGNENTDNLRTIKLLYPCEDDKNKIILRASNPNFRGDTPINIKDIISLYIVKGKITRNQL